MSAETIYRSSHQDVLAAWAAQQAEWEQYQERRDAQLAAWGFAGRPVYMYESVFGRRIAGIAANDRRETPPDGWRRDRGGGYFVPARSTKPGKVIAKEFDAIAHEPRSRAALESFGMPSVLFLGQRITTYAAVLRDGVVWVKWRNADPESLGDDADRNRNEPQVNPEFWERVPLSEFYRMVETGTDPFAADDDPAVSR